LQQIFAADPDRRETVEHPVRKRVTASPTTRPARLRDETSARAMTGSALPR
jgi:hypothetical protein